MTFMFVSQDRELVKVKIARDKVYSLSDQGLAVLQRTGDQVTKPREVFYKHVGERLPVSFLNKSRIRNYKSGNY